MVLSTNRPPSLIGSFVAGERSRFKEWSDVRAVTHGWPCKQLQYFGNYFFKMDTDVRLARLRAYLAVDPSNSDLACELADALLALGRHDEALSTLDRLPAEAAMSPGVRFRRMRLDLAGGRYGEAEALARALLDEGVDTPTLRHDLAFALLCQRRADEAERELAEAERRFGAQAALATLRARVAMMLERGADSVEYARQAVALDPDDVSAQGVLALALFDDSRFDEAGLVAASALARDADQHESLLVAGTLALWRQDVDAAQAAFERGLRRHANSGRALSGLGQALMLRNRLDDARPVLEHAVRAMPDHIGTWHALAWTQLLSGRRDDAETSYRQAYALDRNFGDTHGGLALIDALRGDYDNAEQGIKRALRLDPNAVTARYAQTLVLDARGQHDASQTLMGELLRAGPSAAPIPVSEFAARLKKTLDAKHA